MVRGRRWSADDRAGPGWPGRRRTSPRRPRPTPPLLGRILELEDTRSHRRRRARAAAAPPRARHPPSGGARRRSHRRTRPLVPTLCDLMNDEESEVRQMAAFALGLVGDAARGRTGWSPPSADSEPIVRGRAAEALGPDRGPTRSDRGRSLRAEGHPPGRRGRHRPRRRPGQPQRPLGRAAPGAARARRTRGSGRRREEALLAAGGRASTGGWRPGWRCGSSSPALRSGAAWPRPARTTLTRGRSGPVGSGPSRTPPPSTCSPP